MTPVDAIYQDGVFKPLQTVELPENRRVRLSIEPVEAHNVGAWLDEVRQFQQRLLAERGCFPNSALDIAEDRHRRG
jgi:predicted DNA-binding antitoxin AbrB/MazE fold protein